MQTLPPLREMERASAERDPSYDGVFFVAVKTTGIFCRPSCPARKPRTENVEYVASVSDALFAGYRPCKRCHPLETGGAPPARGRDAEHVTVAWMPSPLGPLVAGASDDAVCLLEFTDRRALEAQIDTLRRRFGMPLLPGRHPRLDQLAEELEGYFAGRLRTFSVPLAYPGTPFQRRVWQELLRIPYGETRSYEQLAVALGAPRAQRAVGHANGLNRIAIVIPCHRVIAKDGTLGGYGGGLWRKRALLDLERGGPAQGLLFT